MVRVTRHFQNLPPSYLFVEIERRKKGRSGLLNLGIGDWTEPLIPSVVEALARASREMGEPAGFRGYGPQEGYLFLREKIGQIHQMSPDEVFISDGTLSDIGAIQDLLEPDCSALILEPSYPAYQAGSLLAGRKIEWARATKANGFQPSPPLDPHGLIFLCHPNNPTGIPFSREKLSLWVEYALAHSALLVVDNVYRDFIQSPEIPRSIFEIKGAEQCAIELSSFSKSAGFSGLRLAYALISQKNPLYPAWRMRKQIKYNGAPYIVQKAAEALFTLQGQVELREVRKRQMEGALDLRNALQAEGGLDSPYVWKEVPQGYDSWSYFDHLLEQHQIVAVPGSGFGSSGDRFIRFSGLARKDQIEQAIERLKETVKETCKLR
jgi:LL-diaminopimelate aminotransferase